MHDDQYGLTGRPFQLTPDPRFWFDSATHKKAMAYLGYGLSQGEGFIVITGDPGTGKTTLLGHLIETIDPERLNVIQLVSTQLAAEDMLRMVCEGLGIDAAQLPKATMLGAIERGLHATARAGKRTLLIVDEAQALPVESLEELRMLSNFQAGGYPLLQIFLVGQPEFRQALQLKQLEQLRQRVIAMHHLEPLEADEVEGYLIHRLSLVGWRGRPRFTNNAISAMHRWSGGNPRRLNMVAGRALLYGAVERIDTFSGDDLANVIADLDRDTPGSTLVRPRPQPAPEPVAAIAPPPAPVPAPEPVAVEQPVETPAAPKPAEPAPANEAALPSDLADRLAAIEAKLDDQDAAIRRVLTLLVDWVESDGRVSEAVLRGGAAA